jgi:hypothetical protein
MPECLPLQQFHGDEGSPIGIVNLVEGENLMNAGGAILSGPSVAACHTV